MLCDIFIECYKSQFFSYSLSGIRVLGWYHNVGFSLSVGSLTSFLEQYGNIEEGLFRYACAQFLYISKYFSIFYLFQPIKTVEYVRGWEVPITLYDTTQKVHAQILPWHASPKHFLEAYLQKCCILHLPCRTSKVTAIKHREEVLCA